MRGKSTTKENYFFIEALSYINQTYKFMSLSRAPFISVRAYVPRVSLIAQLVKNLCAMQETPVQFMGSGRSPGKGIGYPLQYSWASLVAQLVKNPPAMQETWVLSLGWEDPLEKGKDTCSSTRKFYGTKELDMPE